MEAVPRLPMLWFPMKFSPEGTSFNSLKKYIAESYQENPDSFNKEVYALETLRNAAMHPTKDVSGCATLKRYYCQLHSLANRFPQVLDKNLFTFTWKDFYVNNITEVSDFRYEMAAVLFNVAGHHTQLGASVTRTDVDGMKLACTHFQIAAWSYGELREKYQGVNGNGDFMTPELLMFMQHVCFAQAQECILEKSLIDNRKPTIVAKVTAQIIQYYNEALAAMLSGGDDATIADIIGNGVFKDWKKYVRFKIAYLNSILFLYQGQQAEEQQKMGERVTLFQAAWDNLEEARRESKGMAEQKEIIDSLTFTADVVEAKRKAAKNENEFIYHEAVPELKDIAAVQGAKLVNGINFSVTDPEVAGEDIFARLIPMRAHEASSMYSEEKAQLLRQVAGRVSEKDVELDAFMSSLNIENLNVSEERANKIPQGIVDRCASINAKTNAIPDLIGAMSSLAEICADVETNLNEMKELLSAEDAKERKYQQESGVHRTNSHLTELSREFQKYLEAHQKAGDSNDTLRRAMELHVNNLRILSKPLQEIQSSVPRLTGEIGENVFHDLKLILNKVNEMKAQRAQFCADLRIAINDDDITSKIIAFGDDDDVKSLFRQEIAKHDKLVKLIDQNLTAQVNILAALTENYAKSAPVLKTINDVKHKRDNFFSSLAASYDVYEDLLAKSAKGLEFYKKLQGNVQKLLARVRAACDVQSEERQQRMSSAIRPRATITGSTSFTTTSTTKSGTPKLKDYLKSGKLDASIIPPIRPNPLGSEATPSAACVAPASVSYYPTVAQHLPVPNDGPPPPYSPPTQQYYDTNGYTNPIYQNNQISETNLKYDYHNYSAGYDPALYSSQPASYMGIQMSEPSSVSSYSSNQTTSSVAQTTQYPYNVPSEPQNNMSYQMNSVYPYGGQSGDMQPSYGTQQQTNYFQPYPQTQPPIQETLPTQQYQQQTLQHPQQQQLYYSQPSQAASPSPSLTTTTATVPMPASSATSAPSWTPSTITNAMESLSMQNGIQHLTYSPNPQSVWSANQMSQQQAQQQGGYGETAQPQVAAVQSVSAAVPPTGKTWNPSVSQAATTQDTSNIAPYSNIPPPQPAEPPAIGYQTTSQPEPIEFIQSHVKANPAIAAQNFVQQSNYVYNSTTGQYQYNGSEQGSTTQPESYQYAANLSSLPNNSTLNTSSSMNQGYSGQYPTSVDPSQYPAQQPTVDSYNQNSGVNATSYYGVPATHQTPPFAMQPNENNGMTNGQQNYQGTPYGAQTQSSQSAIPAVDKVPTPQQKPPPATAKSKPAKKTSSPSSSSSNIDLLSDIDFSANLPMPALQPQAATRKSESPADTGSPSKASSSVQTLSDPIVPTPAAKILLEKPPAAIDQPLSSSLGVLSIPATASIDRKMSCDNISLCSDLSSLADQSFDWDSVSVRNEQHGQSGTAGNLSASELTSTTTPHRNPFDDPKTLKYFHKEVERYEKMIESLNVKMLNGNTPLVNKWNELQDLLVRDEAKRTTSIGRLFPEKNRSTDCIPYDHARVVLERSTDDYINAAFVKDLGPGCPTFILAQTPQLNTVNDFWSMIWSQKSRTVVCLHTPNEILDPFWPSEFNKEMHFDDFSVTLVKQFDLSHCIELNLKLTMNGADAILDLSLIQIKAWTKSSPVQLLGIAQNILVAYKQRIQEFNSTAPLIMNCLTGSERSGLIALAICSILATQTKRPILINVVDVWYRICSQRKGALRDTNNLELSMKIVLSHGHDLLNKRGIMTSYQMKNMQKEIKIEKQEVKDPLNDLDPLWKLKQK